MQYKLSKRLRWLWIFSLQALRNRFQLQIYFINVKFMVVNAVKSSFWILTSQKMCQFWLTSQEMLIQSSNSPCQKVLRSIDHAQPCFMDNITFLADGQSHVKSVLLTQERVYNLSIFIIWYFLAKSVSVPGPIAIQMYATVKLSKKSHETISCWLNVW